MSKIIGIDLGTTIKNVNYLAYIKENQYARSYY